MTKINDRYLRNRPFLVVDSVRRQPRDQFTGQITSKSVSLFESPRVVDRVNDKQLVEAAVVIDVLNRNVVKNRFAETTKDAEVLEHYLTKYSELVTEGLVTFAQSHGLVSSKSLNEALAAEEANAA